MGEGEEEVDESSFVPNLFICHTVSKLTKLPGKEFFFVFLAETFIREKPNRED